MQRYSLLERITFRYKWLSNMKRLKCNKEFFKLFEYTGKLDDQKKSLNMLVNKRYTTKTNKVVEYTIPPLKEITLPIQKKKLLLPHSLKWT